MDSITIILKLAVTLLLMAQGPNVPADVKKNAMDFANQAIVSATAAMRLENQPIASAIPQRFIAIDTPVAPSLTNIGRDVIELKIDYIWKKDTDLQNGFQYDEKELQGKVVNLCDSNCAPVSLSKNLKIQVGSQIPIEVTSDNNGEFSFILKKDCENNGPSFPKQQIKIFENGQQIDSFNISRNNINCT